MSYTFKIDDTMATARSTINVSFKATNKICHRINRKKYPIARKFMEDIVKQNDSIGGKYHTKSAIQVLNILKSAETNALARNMDPENMMLFISAHQGPKIMRGRRKRKFGLQLKICHVHAVLKSNKPVVIKEGKK